jgi:lincosamide nucleotidyltransferase B/F
MDKPQKLLNRLNEIGQSLERSGHALALIGLGSVGTETARLDAYSDLDFFAIVKDGYQQTYLDDLSWLTALHPVTYYFQNTDDGYKLLYDDDIFCEFAVFDLSQLEQISFAEGRIVWKQPYIDDAIRVPVKKSSEHEARNPEWLIGEALTNLYVGLGRFWRGEKLTAQRFIQGYAVDRLLSLADRIEPEQTAFRDNFTPERRFEQRFPKTAAELPAFVQGYERSPESAAAILAFLERHFDINPGMAAAIRHLCQPGET